MQAKLQPRAYRVREAAHTYGLSRTKLFELIRDGKLRSIKIGRARLILAESLEALLQSAP